MKLDSSMHAQGGKLYGIIKIGHMLVNGSYHPS
jgi:hypothetical protein